MTSAIASSQAELLAVRQVSVLLGCSPTHVNRLAAAGEMPPPVRLGALVRWRAADIRAWIDQGCKPLREEAANAS